jgi:hypothetical protein
MEVQVVVVRLKHGRIAAGGGHKPQLDLGKVARVNAAALIKARGKHSFDLGVIGQLLQVWVPAGKPSATRPGQHEAGVYATVRREHWLFFTLLLVNPEFWAWFTQDTGDFVFLQGRHSPMLGKVAQWPDIGGIEFVQLAVIL